MFLTAQNLFYYLRDTGLASADDVVGGDFGIVEVGRRNRNFLVLRPRTGSLFVKQVPIVAGETVLSFRREAACAQLAHDAGEGTALHGVAPTLRRYDPDRHVLVYDALDPGETLTELVARLGSLPAGVADRLGRTVAACHLESVRPGALAAVAPVLPGEVPWVFQIGEKGEQVMPSMTGGVRQVLEAIRAVPELLYGLAALGAGWRRLALMHGDLKWDNVLVAGPPAGDRELRLIDWELADLGDPLWDVAGMLVSFLQFWLMDVPAQQAADASRAPGDGATVPLAAARALAREFWAAYAETTRETFPLSGEPALLAGRLTGARLVLFAFELVQGTPAMSPHAGLALRLGRDLLAEPGRAMAEILGLGPAATAAQSRADAPWKLGTLNAGSF
jgi:hypothetical protein